MGNIVIEICMLSARGLPRSSSLWKLQWFCVGWIDPNQKYCSKIDSSGTTSPTWRTKFSATVDERKLDLRSLTLNIEVHSREHIFLREKLYGAVKVPLKEFLIRYIDNPEVQRTGVEEIASFQLRKKSSGKPEGFVDVSIRIADKELDDISRQGSHITYWPSDKKSGISLAIEDGPPLTYPESSSHHPTMSHNENASSASYPYISPANYPYMQEPMPNYPQPQSDIDHYRTSTPPPPPPPQNSGFISPFFPAAPQNYAGMPSTKARGRQAGAGFGMGVGAGALSAGAVIFGDDFVSSSAVNEELGRAADSPF